MAVTQEADTYSKDDASNMLRNVDDRKDAVVVINATGTIQMTNKTLLKLFGFSRQTILDERNVSMLMPAPFSQRHNAYLSNYATSGKANIIDSVRQVVSLHHQRYVFPVMLAVTKLSGTGADSMFMGIIKELFGLIPAEVIGRPFKDLVVEDDKTAKLVDRIAHQDIDTVVAADESSHLRGIHVMHKYSSPVEVDLMLERGGTPDEPLVVVNILIGDFTKQLLVSDEVGNLVFMSASLRSWFQGPRTSSLIVVNILNDDFTKQLLVSDEVGNFVFMSASL
eukprot:gene11282-18914_t